MVPGGLVERRCRRRRRRPPASYLVRVQTTMTDIKLPIYVLSQRSVEFRFIAKVLYPAEDQDGEIFFSFGLCESSRSIPTKLSEWKRKFSYGKIIKESLWIYVIYAKIPVKINNGGLWAKRVRMDYIEETTRTERVDTLKIIIVRISSASNETKKPMREKIFLRRAREEKCLSDAMRARCALMFACKRFTAELLVITAGYREAKAAVAAEFYEEDEKERWRALRTKSSRDEKSVM